jgi:hypothetical protein
VVVHAARLLHARVKLRRAAPRCRARALQQPAHRSMEVDAPAPEDGAPSQTLYVNNLTDRARKDGTCWSPALLRAA